MKFSRLLNALCATAALLSGLSVVEGSAEDSVLEVRFTNEGVSFSGRIESEEYGLALAEAVKSVRPDLKILNRGLKVVPGSEAPNLGDLKSLLAELGISTHEGKLSIDEHSVMIGGMTDSRITLTALKIRLDPLLGDKDFINRICIVSKEDLPKLTVHLSTGERSGPLLNFDVVPTAAETYEPPGLSIRNLFPMMLTLSDLSRLKGAVPMTESSSAKPPPRAIPLLQIGSIGGSSDKTEQILRATPTPPQPTYVALSPVLFSRDSFLLQVNQESSLDATIAQLNKPPLAGHPIFVKPVKAASRSGAFGDYLVQKRGEAAKTMLIERGIPAALISIQTIDDPTSLDQGEVQLIIKIPPPKVEPEEEEETPTETASAAPIE